MKSGKRRACKRKSLRNWATLCVLLAVVLLLYHDPFLLFWWPDEPAEENQAGSSRLDMATNSIDDMFDGCLPETASLIDQFGVFEWNFNGNFSVAWALAENKARKLVHKQLGKEHATVLYLYTKFKTIRRDFNRAVKTGKHKYSTDRFMFHYFYFYLTDAVQVLRRTQTSCRTAYLRTWERFDRNVVNANVRFGAFSWVSSSKEFNGSASCFEIYSCLGADITRYSATDQPGQMLIPPYEVFRVTQVLTDDPWCRVVYKLQSTNVPRSDLNCRLSQSQLKLDFGDIFPPWHTNVGMMLAHILLLIVISLVLVKRRQKRFVATVLGGLQVLLIIVVIVKFNS